LNPAAKGGTASLCNPGAGQTLCSDQSYSAWSIRNGGGYGNPNSAGDVADSPTNGDFGGGYTNAFQYPSSGGGGGSGASGVVYAGGDGGPIKQFGWDSQPNPGIIYNGGSGGVETGVINGSNGLDFLSTTVGRLVGATGGGGGGGQSAGVVAGAGGNGGIPGGGGGGGGGSLNGTPSGAGGAGGRGEVWIIESLGTLTP